MCIRLSSKHLWSPNFYFIPLIHGGGLLQTKYQIFFLEYAQTLIATIIVGMYLLYNKLHVYSIISNT